MESTLSLTFKPSFHHPKPTLFNPPNSTFTKSTHPYPLSKPSTLKINASTTTTNPIIQTLKHTTRTLLFSATAALIISKFQQYPSIAQPISQTTPISEPETKPESEPETVLPEFLESNSEAIDAMKTLLEKKLEAGEDKESLNILKKLVSAQPENMDWKFLMARLLNEMGEIEPAREALEQILAKDPLSFEALFENALIMDSVGEGEGVIRRLEKALAIAEDEKKEKEARDVRLIIAQFHFLQKNVDEALRSYDELLKEDPKDFRPYFAKGMIYSLIDKDDEAKVWFAKYRELSPKKFDVEGYIRSPLSRMKLFGTDEQN